MGYLYLILAICGELLGTTCLKYAAGFTKLYPSIGAILSYSVCFFFLSKSLQYIHLSIAYATWCGIGIIAATLLSIFLFKETLQILGIIGIVCIVVGVVLVNLYGTSH